MLPGYNSSPPRITDSATPCCQLHPEGGICYTTLSQGGGQLTATLGCWPSQASEQLAWLGEPECKNGVGRLLCLCKEVNKCNGFLPAVSEITPEGGDMQGVIIILIICILGFILAVLIYCSYKLRKRQGRSRSDVENTDRASLMQGDQVTPALFCNSTYSPLNSEGSPAPMIKMSSAPAGLTEDQVASDWCKVTPRMTAMHRNRSWPVPFGSKDGPLKYRKRPSTRPSPSSK